MVAEHREGGGSPITAVMHLGPREHAFSACFMFSKSRIHASPGRQEAAELQAPEGRTAPFPSHRASPATSGGSPSHLGTLSTCTAHYPGKIKKCCLSQDD